MNPPQDHRHKVELYKTARAMQKGIEREQKRGWSVVSTDTVEQGWGCAKTGCLGILFLPLALLGKRPVLHRVLYQWGRT